MKIEGNVVRPGYSSAIKTTTAEGRLANGITWKMMERPKNAFTWLETLRMKVASWLIGPRHVFVKNAIVGWGRTGLTVRSDQKAFIDRTSFRGTRTAVYCSDRPPIRDPYEWVDPFDGYIN